MTITDDIYANVDDFGLITSAEARALGLGNKVLVQQAARGKLERVARGVYRMPVWPFQKAMPYAIALKAAGPDAYLCGESVMALLELAPTNPSSIWIATPHRVRRNLGDGMQVIDRRPKEPAAYYEGIRCQAIEQALLLAAKSIGPVRTARAAREAMRRGLIPEINLAEIEEGMST